MKPLSVSVACTVALALAACASSGERTPSKRPEAVGGAVSQPFEDLGVVRTAIPDVLASASAAPYGVDEPLDCSALVRDLAALEDVLGPDVDARPANERGMTEGLVLDALQSALSLPFRGIIRRVSGADRRDREKVAAVLAGMVRRGYLRGVIRGAGCPDHQPD